MRHMNVFEYLDGEESLRPQELAYGIVREPPAPYYGHQLIVTLMVTALQEHVRARKMGRVCVSPVDVVLDEINKIIVQPDVVFVAAARKAIIKNAIWGPPDLVVEVLSPSTAARDRTVKAGWYQQYGVRECWLADQRARTIDVLAFATGTDARRTYSIDDVLRSDVLPELAMPLTDVFGC